AIGQSGFLVPGVERRLYGCMVAGRRRVVGGYNACALEAGNHVARQDEAVLADETQEVLSGVAAQPAAPLLQHRPQADQVRARPLSYELTKTARTGGDIENEPCVRGHGDDLGHVAHNPGVAADRVEFVVVQKGVAAWVEIVEGL